MAEIMPKSIHSFREDLPVNRWAMQITLAETLVDAGVVLIVDGAMIAVEEMDVDVAAEVERQEEAVVLSEVDEVAEEDEVDHILALARKSVSP